MPFGISSTGFTLKRLNDILTDMRADLSTVVDPVTGESLNLTDENDPFVQLLNATAAALADGWEQLQEAYNQFNPLTATGAGLSGVVQLNGIERLAGTPSEVVLTLVGSAGAVIPAGKRVSTMDDSVVFVLPEVTLDGNGDGSCTAVASVNGPLEAAAATVVKIVTPVSGWSSVTNAAPATPGTNDETDAELRARQQASVAFGSQSVVESIYAGLSNLAGVTYCRVYQNATDFQDSRGIDPHSVAPVIIGGDDADLAEVLFNRVPAGCGTYGTTTEPVLDAQGISYDLSFSRPATLDVYVEVEVTRTNQALWAANSSTAIEDAVVAFAAAQYQPGENVYASELYTPVNTVPGMKIDAIKIATTPAPSGDTVTVDWNELASLAVGRITVVVN